jgi:hypothetical protein
MDYREYELLIRAIFQQLADQDYVPNILVEHNVTKQGRTTEHQIDVYWKFKLAGIIHQVVVQAKNWATPVDQGEVLKFEAVLRDLPGQPRGIMVTASGYQKGALEVATAHGIKLYELNEEAQSRIELTYTGWIELNMKGYRQTASGKPFAFVVEHEIVTPEFSNLTFKADAAWHRDNGRAIPSTSELQLHPHEIEFYDAEQHFLRSLRDIYSDLAGLINSRGESNATETYLFDAPTFMKVPSTSSLIKVTVFSVEVTIKKDRQERLWKIGDVAMFILKSLDDGETWQFAKVPGGT